MSEVKECKHRLPCGWCDRKNEKCELLQKSIANDTCNHDWQLIGAMGGYGCFFRCRKCHILKHE